MFYSKKGIITKVNKVSYKMRKYKKREYIKYLFWGKVVVWKKGIIGVTPKTKGKKKKKLWFFKSNLQQYSRSVIFNAQIKKNKDEKVHWIFF